MNPWQNFEAATCLPDKCQCEYPREQFIRQPSAFVSTLFVLLVPLILWSKVKERSLIFSCWVGTLTTLAISSFLAHGTFTRLGISFDFASIVLVISFFAYMHVMQGRSKVLTILGLAILFLFTVVGMYVLIGKVKIVLCLGFVAFALWDLHRERGLKSVLSKNFLLPFGILLGSFGLFVLDENHIFCEPMSFWQLHSVWHMGCAVGLYYYGKFRLSGLKF